MGLAIIVPDCDFSSANLGKVTIEKVIPVTSIEITGDTRVIGTDASYSVNFEPTTTSQRDVNWSIVSGSQYAFIDSNGKLSILPSADNSLVTIKAVSANNPSVYATKDVNVSYVSREVTKYVLSINAGANNALTKNTAYNTGNNGNSFEAKELTRLSSTDFIPVNKIKYVVTNGVIPGEDPGSPAIPSILYFSSNSIDDYIGSEYPAEGSEMLYNAASYRKFSGAPNPPDGAVYAIVQRNTISIIPEPSEGCYIEIYGTL